MATNSDDASRFRGLLRRLVGVPKHEIDEREKQDARNRERRKIPKPAAKPGQIVPAEPTSR